MIKTEPPISKSVWKYELQIKDNQQIKIPERASFLSAANQNGKLCVWFLVDPTAHKIERTFAIVGTGHPVSTENFDFCATVLMGNFVWHIFIDRKPNCCIFTEKDCAKIDLSC